MRERGTAIRSGMLEREEELLRLESALTEARAGRGRVVLVGGDAGIGKTTLVRALAESAEPTDVRVRWGKSWEEGGAPAYWPWTQVLRAQTAETDDEVLARQLGRGLPEVAQLVPELGPRLGVADAPSASGDAQGARFRLFDAVSGYLHAAAEEGPLLVILEDLHACDEPSLALLQFVARDLDHCPLLAVGTYRDPEVRSSPRRDRLLRAIAREGDLLVLGGLGSDSVGTMLGDCLEETPPGTLIHQVREATDGNPFFVEEMGRMLATYRGSIRGRLPLPEAVHAAVRTRVEGIGDQVKSVLAVASVLGREFDAGLVSRVSGQDLGLVIDRLGEAGHAGVVHETGLNHWSFVHALVGETLYEGVPPTERRRTHRAVADALHELRPDAVAEIAHHRAEAVLEESDVEAAVSACERAAADAASVLAFEEAEAWYLRALEVLGMQVEPDDRRRYELLCSLAEARVRGGSREEGRNAYRQAHEVARRGGAPERIARAALGVAGMPGEDWALDSATCRAALEGALAVLPDTDSALRARVLTLLGHFMGWELMAGREPEDDGSRLCRAGIEMARRVGDPGALASTLWHWHLRATLDIGTLGERLAVADELVALAQARGDKEGVVLARQWRIADRFEAGDLAGARTELAVATREADELRLPFLQWNVTYARATLALTEGRFGDAERLARTASEIGQRTGFAIAESFFFNHLMFLRRQQGRVTEAEETCRQAIERYPVWEYTTAHCLFLAEMGRLEEARGALDRHLAATPVTDRRLSIFWRAYFGEVCHLVGDLAHAGPLYDALLPFAGGHVVYGVMSFSLGAVDRYLGLLATLLQRFEGAEAHFESAQRLHETMGARPWAAQTSADHGRMLLARGRAGDRERARGLLDRARATFEELGATAQAERIAAFLEAPSRTRFHLDGDEWLLEYEGRAVRLRDSKGLQYLARLLAEAGKEVYALDLAEERAPDAERYRQRLGDLKAEIDDARAAHDIGRLARAEAEFDRLVTALQGAAQTPDAERARQSISRAVRGAIDRISAGHPSLGEHLRTTVRTGAYSSYTPDPRSPIEWET